MLKWLLNAVIVLTLILNGFSAPFAMAAMAHASGDPHQHADRARTADAGDAHAHGSSHHGAASHPVAGTAVQDTQDDVPRQCCDAPSCHCGCVLPSGMATSAPPRATQRHARLEFAATLAGIARPAPTPPFRPPAA